MKTSFYARTRCVWVLTQTTNSAQMWMSESEEWNPWAMMVWKMMIFRTSGGFILKFSFAFEKNIHFLLDFVGLQHVWLWCVHCHVKAPIHMADKQETTRWLLHYSTCSTDLSLWKTNECPLKINGWFRCIFYWKSPFSLGDMLDILHHLRCIKTLPIVG